MSTSVDEIDAPRWSSTSALIGSVLGMLARYLTRSQNAGGALKLCALSPKVNDVLRVTRLKAVFQIYETEADSIADVHGARDRESSIGRPDLLCVDSWLDVLAYVRVLLQQSGYPMLAASNLPDGLILPKTTRSRVVVLGPEMRASSIRTSSAKTRSRAPGRAFEFQAN